MSTLFEPPLETSTLFETPLEKQQLREIREQLELEWSSEHGAKSAVEGLSPAEQAHLWKRIQEVFEDSSSNVTHSSKPHQTKEIKGPHQLRRFVYESEDDHGPPPQQHHHHRHLASQQPPNKQARFGGYEDEEAGPSSVVDQPGMPEPAARPKGPKLKFSPEDDALLRDLKENRGLTWKQISEFFPGRSSGTLQVRYCTKLKAKTVVWTEDMVTRLLKEIKKYDEDRWRSIMGPRLSQASYADKSSNEENTAAILMGSINDHSMLSNVDPVGISSPLDSVPPGDTTPMDPAINPIAPLLHSLAVDDSTTTDIQQVFLSRELPSNESIKLQGDDRPLFPEERYKDSIEENELPRNREVWKHGRPDGKPESLNESHHHRSFETVPHRCPKCDTEYETVKAVRRHLTRAHGIEQSTYYCDKAGCRGQYEGFKRWNILNAHTKRVHDSFAVAKSTIAPSWLSRTRPSRGIDAPPGASGIIANAIEKAFSPYADHEPALILYRAKIRAALGDQIMSDEGRLLDPYAVDAIALEIACIPPRFLEVSSHEKLSLSNYLKTWVEQSFGEQWDWWPLQPKKICSVTRLLSTQVAFCKYDGCIYYSQADIVVYQPSGLLEYVDLPIGRAGNVSDAINSAPEKIHSYFCDHNRFSFEDINKTQSDSTAHTQATPLGNTGAQSPHDSAGDQHQTTSSHPLAVSQSVAASGSMLATSTSQQVAPVDNHPRVEETHHVYMCVNLWDDYEVKPIRTDILKSDLEFFGELRSSYLKARGVWRNWFSMWRYDRSEFFRFQKCNVNLTLPECADFPPEANPNYDFMPRPLSPDRRPPTGPISVKLFRFYFYNLCHPCHSWHVHNLKRYQLEDTSKMLIQALPKCKQAVDMNNGNPETFWGIYARETRCFAWVLAYGILCNLPGMIFFFLWLFVWGHPADLQNAAVPIQLSLSLTLTYIGCLYASTEGSRN